MVYPTILGLQPSKVMQELFHPQYVHVLKSLIIDGHVLRSKHATGYYFQRDEHILRSESTTFLEGSKTF